jgi:DNA primase catalytic core
MDVKTIIKDEVQVSLVAKDLGLQLSQKGNAWKGNCPTGHGSEGGQCFCINTRRNFFHCFNCGIGGDVIRLVEVSKGIPFRDALQWLTEKYRPDLLPELEKYKGSRSPEDQERIKDYYQKAGLLESIQEYGKDLLYSDKGKEQLKYLTGERGYDPDKLQGTDWIFWPPEKDIKRYLLKYYPESKERISELKLVGHFGDGFRLAFPYRDRRGAITGFLKRATAPGGISAKGQSNVRWDSTPGLKKDDLFNLHNCKGKESLLVVEGYPDALYMQTLGFDNVVAVGQGILGDKHIQSLKAFNVKDITISFDNDTPKEDGTITGVKNTSAAIEKLTQAGIRAYVIDPLSLSPDKDPDEVIRARGPEDFKELVTSAERASSWQARHIISKHDLTSDRGMDQALQESLETLAGIEDQLDKDAFYLSIKDETGLSEEQMVSRLHSVSQEVDRQRQEQAVQESLKRMQSSLATGDIKGIETELDQSLQRIRHSRGVDTPDPLSFDAMVDRLINVGEGLKTGYPPLDEKLQIHQGAITIIAGRPAHGKTSVMLNLLVNMMKLYPDKRFCFFSYEEAAFKLASKIIMIMAEVVFSEQFNLNAYTGYYKWRRGQNKDWTRGSNDVVERAINQYEEMTSSGRLLISDRMYAGEDLASVVNKLCQKGDMGAVFIDYIQKIPIEAQAQRYLDIKAVSQALLNTAVHNDVPVIMGSQLNRAGADAKIGDVSVKLEHMRESGDIEQDANLVLAIENSRVRSIEKEGGTPINRSQDIPLYVHCLKNREGMSNWNETLWFKGSTLKITDTEDISSVF